MRVHWNAVAVRNDRRPLPPKSVRCSPLSLKLAKQERDTPSCTLMVWEKGWQGEFSSSCQKLFVEIAQRCTKLTQVPFLLLQDAVWKCLYFSGWHAQCLVSSTLSQEQPHWLHRGDCRKQPLLTQSDRALCFELHPDSQSLFSSTQMHSNF